MKTSSFQKRNGYFVLGGIGLFFAAGYVGMSFRLPFGQLDQPGAGVFPAVVGIMLMVASLTTIWEGWQLGRAEQVEIPVSVARKRLLSLIGLLFGYCLALPWLGQIVSSTLFCVLLVRMLSDLDWPRILAFSLMMSIGLYFVFVLLLKVPLPRGVLAF